MRRAFTLIEMVVLLGILFSLMTLTTINLVRPQSSALVSTTLTQLLADIRSQQLRSMGGDTDATADPVVHGVYFEPNRYTLFHGAVYSAADPSNFIVAVDPSLALATTFPDSSLVFSRGTGDISGYITGLDSITLTHSSSTQTTTVIFNQYGTVIVQN